MLSSVIPVDRQICSMYIVEWASEERRSQFFSSLRPMACRMHARSDLRVCFVAVVLLFVGHTCFVFRLVGWS